MKYGIQQARRCPAAKIALLGFLAGMGTNAAYAEIYNFYPGFCTCSSTGGDASTFTVVFQGNIVSDLNLAFTQGNAGINPFYQLDLSLSLPNTSSVVAMLNSSGNTVVTYSNGAGPAINSSEASDFPSPKGPHFGLQPSSSDQNGPVMTALSESWDNLPSLPVIDVNNPSLGSGTVEYAIVFTQVSSNGSTTGNWFEIPYTGTLPPITLTNPTGTSETLSDAGYQLSPTLIPLDNLNFGTDPPPGYPGSPFTPTPQLDGATVSPGGSLTMTPEPSMLLPLAACAGLFGFVGWRRKQSSM
jgi:hypothetical protein